MARRSEAMNIIAVSIVILFLISGFPVMVYGSGSEESVSPSSMSGNISNTNITPFTQDSSQNNSAGFVKYTLDLINNTLINGNVIFFSGAFPFEVAFDPANGYIYETNLLSDNVAVINGATNNVIANIAVGSEPSGVAFDPSNGYVYVANGGSNTVSVINGATNNVIANIGVGSEPSGVAFDPSNGYVYVTNFYSGTVSIISTSPQVIKEYTVTFTESGLPSGTSWSVTFNGLTQSSTGSSITFPSISPGTYNYTVTAPGGYSASPSIGSVTVSTSNVTVAIAFSQHTYSVTFTETGLPSGTQWSVTLNGKTETSTTNTISFTEPNGTYSFSIASINGYSVSQSSASITVNGTNISQNITFKPVTTTTSPSSNDYLIYIVTAIVVIAAAIGAVVAMGRKKK